MVFPAPLPPPTHRTWSKEPTPSCPGLHRVVRGRTRIGFLRTRFGESAAPGDDLHCVAVGVDCLVIAPEHRILLIKVTQDLGVQPDHGRLYEAVRGWWRVGAQRRDGGASAPEYVAAARDGQVAAVYRIEGWTGPNAEGRWAFYGQPARELTAAYQGMEVASYYPPGAQNPLRYVHCALASAGDGPSLAEMRGGTIEPAAETLAEITRQLDGEPLFHLMLAHRELFHGSHHYGSRGPKWSDSLRDVAVSLVWAGCPGGRV